MELAKFEAQFKNCAEEFTTYVLIGKVSNNTYYLGGDYNKLKMHI